MEESLQYVVGEGEAGQRLDEFLAVRLISLSRMRIAGLVAGGACAVNGAAAQAGRRLGAGDSVEFAHPEDAPNATTPEALPLEIVHEDDHIIVVVKPSGLLVHPTRGVKSGTLANALTYHLNRLRIAESKAEGETGGRGEGEKEAALSNISPSPRPSVSPSSSDSAVRIPQWIRPGIIHRLDRDTSGLMVVAKTQAALSRITQHFQRRLVAKRYLAIVGGRVAGEERTIVAPIGRDEESRTHWRVLEGGKDAETRLRVIERTAGRTLVELEPVTGRTNQLRIHCAHVGHPIIGDTLYGGGEHTRLCLHASRLAFRHPATNEWAEFSSEMPAEVSAALAGAAGGGAAPDAAFFPPES